MRSLLSYHFSTVLHPLFLFLLTTSHVAYGSTRTATITKPAVPVDRWWTAPDAKWKTVSPAYNWKHRRTGIRPKWTAHFGTWLHYRPKELLTKSNNSSNNNNFVLNPKPWTVGRMCKFLRQVTAGSFELKSVYEDSAKGDWGKGFIQRRDQEDRLWQMGHVFKRTPYRITTLPSVLPPSILDEIGNGVADASRVTIVTPDGCTVSGPRWLPTTKQVRELQQWEGKSQRFQFVELWLAEGTAESDKVGAFIMYDGITGELVQIFRMKEVQIPDDDDDVDGTKEIEELLDPDQVIALDALKATIKNKGRITRKDILDKKLVKGIRQGKSLEDIFQQCNFRSFSGRVVKCASPNGPEEEYTIATTENDDEYDSFFSSSRSFSNNNKMMRGHADIRFDDGMYLCIPQTFQTFSDDDEICMEMGCLRLDGGFHRIRMMGSRKSNFDHCAYERWI